MPSCIEAMEEVLASLARGELYNPLRSIARPEGADTLLGLMPSYRGGATPSYGLKEIVVVPANPRAAWTRTWAASCSTTATRGAARDHERIADHRDPDGCRVRGRDARARATGCAASRDSRRGRTGSRPRPRDARRPRRSGDPDLGAPARGCGGAGGRGRSDGLPVHRRCALRRRGRVHDDRVRRADRREALARPRRARERGRIVLPERARARHRDGRALLLLHGPARVVPERGGRLHHRRVGGGSRPDHIKAELGEVLAGMHPGREHEDELTVFESLGIAVEDLASAELVVRRARERGVGVEVPF